MLKAHVSRRSAVRREGGNKRFNVE